VNLKLGDQSSREILNKFKLQSASMKDQKAFLSEIKMNLMSVNLTKKSINLNCLKNYCNKETNSKLELDIGNGLTIRFYKSPLCDSIDDEKISDSKVSLLFLESKKVTIAQITYNDSIEGFKLKLEAPTHECTENEGGTFGNTIISSAVSMTLSPNTGTTLVGNNPVGVALINKKKYLPRVKFEGDNAIFSFGDGYQATIDLNNNIMTSNNILKVPCKGIIARNPVKKTSLQILPESQVNKNGHKTYNTNQDKIYEPEQAKLNW
jgi:hypothetical protein